MVYRVLQQSAAREDLYSGLLVEAMLWASKVNNNNKMLPAAAPLLSAVSYNPAERYVI